MKKYDIYIGIDPGTKTGIAVYDRRIKQLLIVKTLKIHEAMNLVKNYNEDNPSRLLVRFEDARKRKWFGGGGVEKLQGAGSIKRDCKIWEDLLQDLGVDYEAIAPQKGMTKLDPEPFKMITGWKGRTSNHARDAAMLVYGS